MDKKTALSPLIALENITALLGRKAVLEDVSWRIAPDENWAVLGPNGSGKTTLLRVLSGDLKPASGTVHYASKLEDGVKIATVTHEQHRDLIALESTKNIFEFEGEYSGKFTTARQVIGDSAQDDAAALEALSGRLGITPFLDKGVKYLSTGEMRKVLIARALMANPALLVLDEPFEGLDAPSRQWLRQTLDDLMKKGIRILLITHRVDELPCGISHILCMKDCRAQLTGAKEEVLATLAAASFFQDASGAPRNAPEITESHNHGFFEASDTLVAMKDVCVRYNSAPAISGINWTMKKGENWAITGPNGAGKSTLLSLISGDNPKAYGNEIYLFGKRRGTGETVWDIKQKVGLVSSEFQIGYQQEISAFSVVLSGFFDSVGLYDRATWKQREIAATWIRNLSIEEKADRVFSRLSYGEQRAFLLARAMVKMPLLLMLDEPCQGLDAASRKHFLRLVDHIGQNTPTHILYVTHHETEEISCIDHRLNFVPMAGGGYTAECVSGG